MTGQHDKYCELIRGQATLASEVLLRNCGLKYADDILCEKPAPPDSNTNTILINGTNRWPRDPAYIMCPSGHYTQQFLACDFKSDCWYRDGSLPCRHLPDTSFPPPSFACASRMERVPYTLVCDHRADCHDGSDEHFCTFPPCWMTTRQFSCDNKQCFPATKYCDGWLDCHTGEDENGCHSASGIRPTLPPPALVIVRPSGHLEVLPLPGTCPDTHFQCPNDGYCLPVMLRCNDVYDCPGREDEQGCRECPGFYRCRASRVCLPDGCMCDGHAHCPQHDDEAVCDLTCPSACLCRGLAFSCSRAFNASAYPHLRFLDASGSGMTPDLLTASRSLVYLSLTNCGLARADGLSLPNLLSLDIGDNGLRAIGYADLVGVTQLRKLAVAGNPLAVVFEGAGGVSSAAVGLLLLTELDLSRVVMHDLNVTALSVFSSLRVLNLSHSRVRRVLGEGFVGLPQLRIVDVRGCPMTRFPRTMFQSLRHLRTVRGHSFKVCCPVLLPPDFSLLNCFAPSNELSSCDNLLRAAGYSVCVFVLSVLALAGNAVSFVFRTFVSKRDNKLGYGHFVTHLSVADLLMGVYLAVIGVADRVYQGAYLWNDVSWRHSAVCTLAGFLSLLSSEVSALIMCLITVDRFLVLRFPFSRIHFSPGSAHLASVVVWTGCVLLALLPLLPLTSHWEFYSQTGICIPLPVTRTDFAGQNYSFGIFIVFNFIVFIFISLGQLSIYWSIRANSMSVSSTSKKTKDLTIARRLISVAMTDFLCWFPIGVLGLLASNGTPVPGEANVAVAIFVLPLNSAVNPCLYTFNVIMERRSRALQEKLRASLLAQLKAASG